ncbi:MAG TPA: hypothetical protein VFS77_13840 [Pyrinomonadaceae bacterium]|nr:hypothetical protein [Pyrinomonadaceae bacterium]
MKRHVLLTIAIMIICGVSVVSAEAQTLGSQTIRAKIPFTFTVGQKTLPAGVYSVTILNPASDRKALQIRSADGRASAIIQTTAVKGSVASTPKFVFRRYGDRHFFAQVQMAGDVTTLAAVKTNAERAAQRSLKLNNDRSVVAIVAQ